MARASNLTRAGLTALALLVTLVAGGAPASAATQLVTEYGEPERICRTTDNRLDQVSGAIAQSDGYVVHSDRNLSFISLDADCAVTSVRRVKTSSGVDAEDMARGPDGTLWIADTGGNRLERPTIRMVGLQTDGTTVEVPFATPARGVDLESAIVTQDYELVLISKREDGRSRVYTAPLVPTTSETPGVLRPVGIMDASRYRTDDGRTPSQFVTGAAFSPDGMHVAIRTASDVFEYDVESDDIARELVTETPRWVGRVTQPQGEAITYTPDGTALVMFSEQRGSPVFRVAIDRTYPGADLLPVLAKTLWIPVVAVLALALLTALALGVRLRSRRRTRSGSGGSKRRELLTRLGRPWLLAATLTAVVVWSGTLAAAPRLQAGWTSTTVVALTPRSPTTIGADTVVLLGPRYVALLESAPVVEAAGRNVGVSAETMREGAAGLIQPETLNLEVAFTGADPTQTARSANALAAAIISAASQDPLIYGVQVAVAVPTPSEPARPRLSDVVLLGGVAGLVSAIVVAVLFRRRWPDRMPSPRLS